MDAIVQAERRAGIVQAKFFERIEARVVDALAHDARPFRFGSGRSGSEGPRKAAVNAGKAVIEVGENGWIGSACSENQLIRGSLTIGCLRYDVKVRSAWGRSHSQNIIFYFCDAARLVV